MIYIIMGIGDWGLGIGDWGLGPIPNPQSPIPNPHYKIIHVKKNLNIILLIIIIYYLYKLFIKIKLYYVNNNTDHLFKS